MSTISEAISPLAISLTRYAALFSTFTGPPFQDKAIPVKVTLAKPADAANVKTQSAPVSGASSPYVAPDGAVVGPPEEALGDGGDVVVVDIVDKHTGVTVQVWLQVDETLDPAARGADRLPGHGIERLKNAASHLSESLPRVRFTLESDKAVEVALSVNGDAPHG